MDTALAWLADEDVRTGLKAIALLLAAGLLYIRLYRLCKADEAEAREVREAAEARSDRLVELALARQRLASDAAGHDEEEPLSVA